MKKLNKTTKIEGISIDIKVEEVGEKKIGKDGVMYSNHHCSIKYYDNNRSYLESINNTTESFNQLATSVEEATINN